MRRYNDIIIKKIDGHTGTAEIKWIEETQWGVAHYGVLLSVPFKDSRWENLSIYDKEKLADAKEKAEQYLEWALSTCTLF